MSKERLEEIERYHSNKKDVMWAVRQIKLLQNENETLSSANQDLLHEVRVLRNKVDQSKEYEDFVFHHNVDVDLEMRKIHEKNKRYREAIEVAIHNMKVSDNLGVKFALGVLEQSLESDSE